MSRTTLSLLFVFAAGSVASAQLAATNPLAGLSWSAQSTIVTAGANPNDPLYATPRGGAFDGVAALFLQRTDGNFLCTGSLLAKGGGLDMITAGHCLADNTGTVVTLAATAVFFPPSFPGLREFVTASNPNDFVVNPLYTGEVIDAHDVGVIHLDAAPTPDITRYDLYSGPTINQIFRVVGSGATGNGTTGAVVDGGFNQSDRRTGQNRYDFSFTDPAFGGFFNGLFGTADPSVLVSDFDNGNPANDASCVLASLFAISTPQFCDTGLGADEVSIAPGDSGGPEFINGQISSVTSFDYSPRIGADIDNKLDQSFGEFAGYTNVQDNLAFINSATAPEPGSIVLLGTGLLGIGVVRFRRRAGKTSKAAANG